MFEEEDYASDKEGEEGDEMEEEEEEEEEREEDKEKETDAENVRPSAGECPPGGVAGASAEYRDREHPRALSPSRGARQDLEEGRGPPATPE
eukprot:scaffold125065_cov30-Tisochrysis_lutea.AAC.2